MKWHHRERREVQKDITFGIFLDEFALRYASLVRNSKAAVLMIFLTIHSCLCRHLNCWKKLESYTRKIGKEKTLICFALLA